jgi:hypothetical protein
MVSDASPGTADPKMNESIVHTALMSSDCACAQDGYFERPHPPLLMVIRGQTVVGFLLVLELADI